MTRRLRFILAVTASVIAMTTVILSFQQAARSEPPPAASAMTGGFQDRATGAYLRVQLDSSQSAYGSFAAAIPRVGLLWPATQATVSPVSTNSIQLRYDGQGFLQADAHLDTEFGVNYQPAGPIQEITLRLVGQVDPDHKTGSIEIWLNGTHYHLGATEVPQTADTTVNTYLTTIAAGDWATLYMASDSSLRNSISQGDFVQAMSTAIGAGKIASATVTGPTTYTTSSAGVGYATTPISLIVSLNGGSSTYPGTLTLIFDGGQWRVLTVDFPS